MKKTLLCVAAAAVALLSWYAFSPPSAYDVAPTAHPGEIDTASRAFGQSRQPDHDTTPAAPTDVLTRQPVANGTEGAVRLRCVWESDGEPVPSIDVLSYRTGPRGNVGPLQTVSCDARGEVTFAGLPVGDYLFRATGGKVAVTVEPDRLVEANLKIGEFARVSGTVIDDDSRPVEGAMVDAATGWDLPRTHATTGKDGSFQLRLAAKGQIWAHKADWQPSRMREITGSTEAVVLTLPAGGYLLEGVVLDPRGKPVAAALVAVAIDTSEDRNSPHQPPVVLRTDDRGRYSTREVPLGKHTAYALAEGYAFGQAEAAVEPDGPTAAVTVQLRVGATIHGIARDGDQRDHPVAGLGLLIMRERDLPGLRDFLSDRLVRQTTTTDATGSYRFTAVPPGRMFVVAMVRTPKNTNVILQDGEDLEWNPDLSPLGSRSIRGVLEGPDGDKLANWRIQTQYINLATRTPEVSQATTDAEGGFELRNLRDMPYDVSAFSPNAPSLVFAVKAGQRPGGPTLLWRLLSLPVDNGSIVGRVSGPDGQPLDGVHFTARSEGVARGDTALPGAEATFRIDNLSPGVWSVSGWAKSYGFFDLGRHTITARANLDIGSHQLEAQGRAIVRVQASGQPATGLSLQLMQVEGAANKTSRFELRDGAMRSSAIPPGRYRLTVCSEGIAPIEQAVDITPGADSEIDLDAERATTVAVEFVPEALEGNAWQDSVSLELSDASGRKLIERSFAVADTPSHIWRVVLPPGAYTIAGTSYANAYRRGSEMFVVPAASAADGKPMAVRVLLAVQK